MKLVRFVIIISGICMILTDAYASEESRWIEGILNSDDSVRITKEINEQHIKEADYFIQQGSVNPVVWYLRGGFGSGQLGFYYDDLQNAGKLYLYRLNSPKVQALIKEYQSYYQKAMELDDNPDAPEHLTAMMLSRIGTDSVGDPAIKARALEKAAALARAGKNDSGSEMFEWYTYEDLLGIYEEAKDYANYIKTLDTMMERFANDSNGQSMADYQNKVIARAASWSGDVATQDTYAQADTYSAPKPAAVEQVKADEPKKVAEPEVKNKSALASDNTLLWWLLGGGIGLFGVIVLLMRRKPS